MSQGLRKATALLCAIAVVVAVGAAALASAETTQRGTLRLTVNGKLAPRVLPRRGAAPIVVSVGSDITTTDETLPPQLRRLRIEINRHGHLDTRGLPTCPYRAIRTATSAQALKLCRAALVGQGTFNAMVSLANQEPYPVTARLLVFNARFKGKPALFGQLYAARPFATSFVIVFRIARTRKGGYGTILNAAIPKSLGNWGVVTGIQMNLKRIYRVRGRRHSFLSSGCPAPKGFRLVTFNLARTSFRFAGGPRIVQTLTRSCVARG
jgi:hypothetical protein